MRPYLAILKDSFREAMASRVLWILLVLSTLVLAALAPVGIKERTGIVFTANDITDGKALIDKIKRQQAAAPPSPGKQIWTLLSDDYKADLAPQGEPSPQASWPGAIYFRLPGELNTVIGKRELYNAQAWSGITLNDEARELLAGGIDRLDDEDVSRLNRLLLEAAYPAEIAASREKAVAITYFWWRAPAMPLAKHDVIAAAVHVLQWFFGSVIGVFAGVLVTASIIPQTYSPGAIDLLLSKPISRSLLFLTKYLGGCMFVLLNGGYVVLGLWLIAGLRWGEWNQRILLVIPVLVFLFAVYYAVSSLAGVIWRNAIVSIVMAVLFWAACFGVGSVKGLIEPLFLNPERLIKLVPAADGLIAVNERAEIFHWQTTNSAWEEVLKSSEQDLAPRPPGLILSMIGPVYDAKHERLLALPATARQFGFMPTDNALVVGTKQGDWERQEGIAAPVGTAVLLVDRQGTLLAVTPRGLSKLTGDPVATEPPAKVFGFSVPSAEGSRFTAAGGNLRLGTPLSAAIDRANDEIALFDTQTLRVLSPNAKGRYVQRASREMAENLSGVVAIGGGRVLLARANGEIDIFDSARLEKQETFRPEAKNAPRFADVSADGKTFAVLFHNRRLWMYDAAGKRPLALPISGQGDLSAASFSGDRLLLADRFTRVTAYDLSTGQVADRRRPDLSVLEKVYLFGVQPIYTVFPKPGEMSNVAAYLLTGSESATVGVTNDLQAARPKLDIWMPIWSNLAFIAVVVGLGCFYTSRKDF
ncbi:MAG TPA: ABC transporter permease subunit [Pirellulales bacterium]